jgi:hypothetical protein
MSRAEINSSTVEDLDAYVLTSDISGVGVFSVPK